MYAKQLKYKIIQYRFKPFQDCQITRRNNSLYLRFIFGYLTIISFFIKISKLVFFLCGEQVSSAGSRPDFLTGVKTVSRCVSRRVSVDQKDSETRQWNFESQLIFIFLSFSIWILALSRKIKDKCDDIYCIVKTKKVQNCEKSLKTCQWIKFDLISLIIFMP